MARSHGANRGEEWAQEVLGRPGGTPISGAGPNHGGETTAAVLQSSGGSGGRRKVGGTYMEILKKTQGLHCKQKFPTDLELK